MYFYFFTHFGLNMVLCPYPTEARMDPETKRMLEEALRSMDKVG